MPETIFEITEVVSQLTFETNEGETLLVESVSGTHLEFIDSAPQGISGADGADGADGHTPTTDELNALIAPLIISANDARYTHMQFTASAVWTINHELGKYPAVTAVDSSGRRVYGKEEYPSLDTTIITFSAAFGGKAFCN